MNEPVFNPSLMAILGTGLCIKDNGIAAQQGFHDCALDVSLLPAMVRRRTSLATRVAISAATRACANADSSQQLPAIFVSLSGEIQVTDKLCRAIAKNDYPLSPTQFHNSVHNTASSYWSMAADSQAPMMAMAALEDGFALGLLESWCQLQTGAEKVLLVVYEEEAPQYLLPDYHWQPCAVSLVLGQAENTTVSVSCPLQSGSVSKPTTESCISSQNPAMAALPLLKTLISNQSGKHRIEVSQGSTAWLAEVIIP